MLDFNFYSPTKIFFGEDKTKLIGSIINDYGYHNILIVIGKNSVKASGLLDLVINSLNEFDIKYHMLEGVEPNPKIDLVRSGTTLAKEEAIDFILAIGGGSVIDTAKAIACGYYLDCDPWKLSIHEVIPTKALKIGVILTISAAGSELSNSCVISNPEFKIKNGFDSDIIRPLFVIENPKLTYTVNKFQTGCGTVDIMMHTLERFLVETENDYFEEEIALGLLRSVIKAGKIVYHNPNDYNARATLMLASSFSHNGLTGLGTSFYFTVHKLEHELSGSFDHIAHGAGLSVLFIGWARAVYDKLPHKFARIGRDLFDIKEDDDIKASIKGIDKLEEYFKSLEMPTRLSELGVYETDFMMMANHLTKNDTTVIKGFVNLDKALILKIFNLVK